MANAVPVVAIDAVVVAVPVPAITAADANEAVVLAVVFRVLR